MTKEEYDNRKAELEAAHRKAKKDNEIEVAIKILKKCTGSNEPGQKGSVY